MRVLFVLRKLCYNYDGASKVLTMVCNELANKGIETYCYVYSGIIDDNRLSSNVVCLKGNGEHPINQTRKTIKNVRPDVIISFITNANTISILASSGLKIPVIVCERSDPYLESNAKIKMMRQLYRFASGAVFKTTGAQQYYKWVKNSVVIANPIEKSEFRVNKKFSERKMSIAAVSRLDIRQKRLDILLESFSIIRKKRDVHLDIYGDGLPENRAKVENIIRELKLEKDVTLHGKVTDVLEKISDSKMYVLSSDFEGIPNSLLEAMSIGMPVVSTDCSPGGARLLIENGVNGLLVKTGNSGELASAMEVYFENPDFADTCGKAALSVNEKFSASQILYEWERYIKSIARKK